MKILLITKSFTKGGAASGASNLAIALEAAGAEVLRFDAYKEPRFTLSGIARVIERIIERIFFNPEIHCIRLGPPVFNLQTLCNLHQPDVIQLCDVSGNVICFNDIAKVQIPVIHRMSDFWPYKGPAHYASNPNESNPIAKWLLHKTIFKALFWPDLRIAPSEWLANSLYSTTEQSPIKFIRNALTIPTTQSHQKIDQNKLRFGFISNNVLDPRKGFLSTIPLLQALADKGVNVTFHIYGHLSIGKTPSIRGVNVISHGSFCRSKLDDVYNSFDILLCPSRLDNSPNVLTEALAHARPVIAQIKTGMDSYITSNTGKLIDFYGEPQQTIENFCDASKLIALNYENFSHASVTYANEFLSPSIIGRQYLDMYEQQRRINNL